MILGNWGVDGGMLVVIVLSEMHVVWDKLLNGQTKVKPIINECKYNANCGLAVPKGSLN